jgi:hypothetical protein
MKAFLGSSSIALTIAVIGAVSMAQPASGQQGMQNMPGMKMPEIKKGQTDPKEAAIQANLAKLSPEDRKSAEAQKFCAIQTKNRLGSMGTPVKITVKGKPVFLCCNMCVSKAQAEPDKTLASVADLKEQTTIETNLASLKSDERKLVEAQKFCAVETKNRLGSMGAPVKLTVKGQTVWLCCKDCEEKAQADPDKTLAAVASLIKANKK